MSRFYTPPQYIFEHSIRITDPLEVNHIVNVMRLKAGDPIVTFDGRGEEYEGRIEKAGSREVVIQILQRRKSNAAPAREIALAQALPKKEKMDYIVEKCTELGVRKIIPIVTERTVVLPDSERIRRQRGRWQKIALEACKQSGRADTVEIEDITDFKTLVSSLRSVGIAIMPTLEERSCTIREALSGFKGKTVLIIIGPEGGFSPKELEQAKGAGCIFVTLGPTTLKSDTAAVAAMALTTNFPTC